MKPRNENVAALVQIKLLHTAVWLFFVACIVALPLAGAQGAPSATRTSSDG